MLPATRFSLLFAMQFFALGAAMPFVPVVLALGTAVRLVANLVSARVAELVGTRLVLVVGSIIAGLSLPGLALAEGVLLLMVVQVVHGVAVAPIVPLSDAAAVAEIRRRPFDYGRVRAWGSLAFIAAALLSGQAVFWGGPLAALCLAGAALLAAGLVASGLPLPSLAADAPRASLWSPLQMPGFPRLLLCSALIQGSHAVYYGFSTLHWRAAGLSPSLIGALWAWGVMAEVLLFFYGRRVADHLGSRGLALLAATCGMLRWSVTGSSTDVPVLFAAQTLHAGTFGAMHLAASHAMARLPSHVASHAQSIHSALGVGLASGLMMLAAGPLYAQLDGHAFLVMAGVCGLGAVAAAGLPSGRPAR